MSKVLARETVDIADAASNADEDADEDADRDA
jgi:hypothetical protein